MLSLSGQHPRVLVVGDLMIDQYLFGSAERISPEAPVPVVDITRETAALGGAGNVIRNLLALGAQVRTASVIGSDPSGEAIVRMLGDQGVSTSDLVQESGRTTPRKMRVVVTQQQVVRLDRESRRPITAATEGELLARVRPHIEWAQCILLSDYAKGVLTDHLTQQIICWARDASIPLLVDPKGNDGRKYRGATLVTPNRKEAGQLAGMPVDSQQALEQAGKSLRWALAAEYLLVTLSEAGMALFGPSSTTHIPALAREVYDVTGAGDTVLAALGFALGCGLAIEDAARLANRAAAVVVGKAGSATATLNEIAHFGDPQALGGALSPVLDAHRMQLVARALRSQGKTIVFTNGCFDLLHRGHVEYLQASRACGDLLIVGVNSDQSVRRLKGPGRPIVGEQDRSHILAALKCVDYVVLFDEETPYELIRQVRPHILTKGADYANRHIAGSDLVDQVRLISLIDGRSTSRTIEQIRHAA